MEMEYHGIKGDAQVLDLNNWKMGCPFPEMWETGRTDLGRCLGKSLAYVSFPLDWKFFMVEGLSY